MANVLIVDDDLDFARAVGTALESHGHQIDIEVAPEKTIQRIRDRRPDVVVLDVMFPEDDTAGFEIARSIRRIFGDLPVLMLTAVNQAFPLGFSNEDRHPTWLPITEFLEKPVDLASLCDKVANLLTGVSG